MPELFFHLKPLYYSMPCYYKCGNIILIDRFTFDKESQLINLFRNIPSAAHGVINTYPKPAYSPVVPSGELLFKR